jgi:MFS family permease
LDTGRAETHPNLILGICCLSLLMVAMDATIVNVALPSIRHDLAASISGLQWVIDAYTMVVASLLMLAGSMADRFGRRRVFQSGMALFMLGSLLCSVAPNIHSLIAFRILQALGATMLNPVAMSIIANTFHEPKARARAIGVWGAVAGVAMALGPVIGGALTESIGWRSIFWVNLPIGAAAMLLAARYIPESKAPHPRRVDPIGQLLVFVILATVTYAVIEGPHAWVGLDDDHRPVRRCRACVDRVAYLRTSASRTVDRRAVLSQCALQQRDLDRRMQLLGVLRLPVPQCAVLAGSARPVGLPYRFVHVAARTGDDSLLAVLRATGRHLWHTPLVAGLRHATVVSALMMTQLTATTPLPFLLLTYVIFGIGFGMVNAPITNTAVSGMPKAQAGLAAAVASTSRQIGASLGVALGGHHLGCAHT